jgi:hypothetical protein
VEQNEQALRSSFFGLENGLTPSDFLESAVRLASGFGTGFAVASPFSAGFEAFPKRCDETLSLDLNC